MGIDVQLVACIIPLCGSMRQVWEDLPSDSYDDQARSGIRPLLPTLLFRFPEGTLAHALSGFCPTYNPYPKYSSRLSGMRPPWRICFTNLL